ncbi:HET domain-containing protein [Fusarium flagelliforme]|uniref:HET domain-containing protein n=1 Tax=Fusarium flagelliforme TaxID=2675880 RepID=UPI001E8DDF91|nr:HET domain-containing protein [Fusarium flagelliforme]KAH7191810.1 HET domain-containing protein [Fusarium flagelliforme]
MKTTLQVWRSDLLPQLKNALVLGFEVHIAFLIARPWIRHIRLNPDLDYPVSGQLEVAKLENPSAYYAISHFWIPGELPTVVHDGDELRLSKSLSTCIRRLQQPIYQDFAPNPAVRHIRIDNICINQADTPKKSRQVALMKQIYSQSIRTIIWLGEPESALIKTQVRKSYPTYLRTYYEGRHLALGLPPLDDLRWRYLKRLMSLRWFSRIWVVQEVIHAWELLGWATAWLRRSGYMRLPQLPEELRNVDTISNLRRSATPRPLAALISITQIKFQATDQRDKIYGLLGLAAECQGTVELPKALRPDYSLENESLAMLTRAKSLTGTETSNNRQHDLALPSWCPDWSDFHSYNLGISTSLSWIHYPKDTSPAVLGFPNQYRASGDSKLEFSSADSSAEDESILQLYGSKVDQVHGVHRLDINRARDGEEVDDLGTKMAPALELAMSLVTPHGALPWAIRFIQSTTANQHQLNGEDTSQGSADGAAWLWNFFQRPENIPPALSMMSQLEELAANGSPERYEALVRNFCFDRAFVTTSEGRMGIAPSNTQVGDVILVIPGGGVPYIARPLGQYWLFVGESYIDGLMEGQAVQTCNGPRLQKQAFSFM